MPCRREARASRAPGRARSAARRTRAPCTRRAAWPGRAERSYRTRAAELHCQSCEELRLEQRQDEIDQESQRHEPADDIEEWHCKLLHTLAELDECPRDAEEEHAQSDVENISPVHAEPPLRTIAPIHLKKPSRSRAGTLKTRQGVRTGPSTAFRVRAGPGRYTRAVGTDRPDPEALLARVKAEEARQRRGKLKVFLGAAAGVGKTYAMLEAVREQKADGVDALVGYVETHGRAETDALLEGLEILPPRTVDYRSTALREFDLDAALARRPALILVDELAHTNAPGVRHPKRWQDIDELLAMGIDVFTTLNVQHLESLNDVVGGITGIRVWETVPDTFFDAADDVILVDVPADELLARLKAGKVYVPEQIERAADNFFRKGNLMALRELALRRTADRVEEDVQTYRTAQAIDRIWKTEASLLCCVGPDPGGEHVVRSAARLANQVGVEWTAVYVETPKLQRLPSPERERILRTVKLAHELGAKTAILSGGDAATAIVEYAHTHNCSKVVVGRKQVKWTLPWIHRVARRIGEIAPDVDVIEMGRGETAGAMQPVSEAVMEGASDPRRMTKRLNYLWTLLACVATTLIAMPLLTYFDLAN